MAGGLQVCEEQPRDGYDRDAFGSAYSSLEDDIIDIVDFVGRQLDLDADDLADYPVRSETGSPPVPRSPTWRPVHAGRGRRRLRVAANKHRTAVAAHGHGRAA